MDSYLYNVIIIIIRYFFINIEPFTAQKLIPVLLSFQTF